MGQLQQKKVIPLATDGQRIILCVKNIALKWQMKGIWYEWMNDICNKLQRFGKIVQQSKTMK